tara:strand:+ start:1017 stop:1337 length:321 start_codon:yes stop_codon:yes gene_type:complete
MTNEAAIKMIRDKHRTENKAEKLAAMYAMDDIIYDDIEVWLSKPIHRHIDQFVSIGLEVLEDYMCEPFTDEDKQRTFAEGAIGIAESMYHYALIHHELQEESMSER